MKLIIGFFILFFVAAIIDATHRNKCRYNIHRYDRSEREDYYTNSYEIKDGCIIFQDYEEGNVTICGSYVIHKQ